jgi:molecular chaperone GrpE
MKVHDRRHGARRDDDAEESPDREGANGEGAVPATVDVAELEAARSRAEAAERKLREVQEAFLTARSDLEKARERVERDLERRVGQKFGDLVADLLESLDDLDRALAAGARIPAAASVLEGVTIVRDRFLTDLQRAGVDRIDPTGEPFDPNVAEAVGVAPVDDPAKAGTVVQVVRAGYRLGDRVFRPARVLVGRHVP